MSIPQNSYVSLVEDTYWGIMDGIRKISVVEFCRLLEIERSRADKRLSTSSKKFARETFNYNACKCQRVSRLDFGDLHSPDTGARSSDRLTPADYKSLGHFESRIKHAGML